MPDPDGSNEHIIDVENPRVSRLEKIYKWYNGDVVSRMVL